MHVALADADPVPVLLQERARQPEPLVALELAQRSSRACAASGAGRRRACRCTSHSTSSWLDRPLERLELLRGRQPVALGACAGPAQEPRPLVRGGELGRRLVRAVGRAVVHEQQRGRAAASGAASDARNSGMCSRSFRNGTQTARITPPRLPESAGDAGRPADLRRRHARARRGRALRADRRVDRRADAPAAAVGHRRRRLDGRHARDRRAVRAPRTTGSTSIAAEAAHERARGAPIVRAFQRGCDALRRAAGGRGQARRRPVPARALLRVGRGDVRARSARGHRRRRRADPRGRALGARAGQPPQRERGREGVPRRVPRRHRRAARRRWAGTGSTSTAPARAAGTSAC